MSDTSNPLHRTAVSAPASAPEAAPIPAIPPSPVGPLEPVPGEERDASSRSKLTLTFPDAAWRLSISTRTVRRLVAMGQLKSVRYLRSVRVTAESIADYIRRGGTKP